MITDMWVGRMAGSVCLCGQEVAGQRWLLCVSPVSASGITDVISLCGPSKEAKEVL